MAEKGPLSGKLLGGKYLLGDLLGKGTFGAVYSGHNKLLKRPQAIKVLHEHHSSGEKSRARFVREAELVATLDHVNIVHIDDFGVEKQALRAYFVMPYVSGGTFHSFLEAQQELLSLEQITDYLEQICSALNYAHQQNIMHLDLKPLNLLIHGDGRLLLSDFGLAHSLEQQALQGGTSLGQGTPYYQAPEHSRGRPDRSSDIYSLGVLLYRMLTGRLPFYGETSLVIMMKHATEIPSPLQTFRPTLPSELEEVVQRALAKQVTERYQSADELLKTFKSVLALEQERARKAEKAEEEDKLRGAFEAQVNKIQQDLTSKIEEERSLRIQLSQAHEEVERIREEEEKHRKEVEAQAHEVQGILRKKLEDEHFLRLDLAHAYKVELQIARENEEKLRKEVEAQAYRAQEELTSTFEEEPILRLDLHAHKEQNRLLMAEGENETHKVSMRSGRRITVPLTRKELENIAAFESGKIGKTFDSIVAQAVIVELAIIAVVAVLMLGLGLSEVLTALGVLLSGMIVISLVSLVVVLVVSKVIDLLRGKDKFHSMQLGAVHPDTASSLNNLAGLYHDQGRYREAEPLYQRAMAICEQQLGDKHPTTCVIRGNYAILLRAIGRMQEATLLEAKQHGSEGNEV